MCMYPSQYHCHFHQSLLTPNHLLISIFFVVSESSADHHEARLPNRTNPDALLNQCGSPRVTRCNSFEESRRRYAHGKGWNKKGHVVFHLPRNELVDINVKCEQFLLDLSDLGRSRQQQNAACIWKGKEFRGSKELRYNLWTWDWYNLCINIIQILAAFFLSFLSIFKCCCP